MEFPSYSLGDRGPAISEIRERLALIKLLDQHSSQQNDLNDDLFDKSVDTAVRIFQQNRNLMVDGVVGPATYQALEEARWRIGDRILLYQPHSQLVGDDVAQLQNRLTSMGFDAGRIDGIFGQKTERALREFQYNVGLPIDGTCGPAAFKALNRLERTVVGGKPHALRAEEILHRSGPNLSGKVVVLDPGHGIDEVGNSSNGISEAEIVSDIASRIEGRLVATGVFVFLTRGKDSPHLTEMQRANFANTAQAQLCVSLHVDKSDNIHANGVASYYYGNDLYGHSSPLGERFANLIQREIVARTDLANCRSHGKTWEMLRMTQMPTVRVELGYVTNQGDSQRLAEPAFRDVIAEAITAAIQRMFIPAAEDYPTGKFIVRDAPLH